jgi:methylenetetrahydrofolate reductase (NADPH)
MSLSKFYVPGRLGLSFELFPPRTDEGVDNLLSTVRELQRHNPDFFTCTYGAGGSTQERTLQIVAKVKEIVGCPVATHLTCVGTTKDGLRDYLRRAGEMGVDYVVALRGDPPKGETMFVAVEGGLRYANELVSLICAEFKSFGIAVAGYPEVHQEAVDGKTDLENLKRKVDAGADVIVTQLFYKNEDYFRFCDDCRAIGITVPIIPGIMPVTNLSQIQRIASLCKASLPESFVRRLGENDSPDWQFRVGVEQATEQVQDLIDRGIPGLHFYVLNKSQATGAVLDGLNLKTA